MRCSIFNLSLLTNVIPKVWKSAFFIPLLKEGDPTILNHYRPISKLSVLAKVVEYLVSEQVKEYLATKSILSISQSGFCKKHSTSTAALKVINDITEALDNKQCCLSLLIDFSKAFDTVDHDIFTEYLQQLGFLYMQLDGLQTILKTEARPVHKGVPQGSVLGLLLFSLYLNNIGMNISNAALHFYADDTVLYCFGPTPAEVFAYLQNAFNRVQEQHCQLQLVLNADKTTLVFFTNSKSARSRLFI